MARVRKTRAVFHASEPRALAALAGSKRTRGEEGAKGVVGTGPQGQVTRPPDASTQDVDIGSLQKLLIQVYAHFKTLGDTLDSVAASLAAALDKVSSYLALCGPEHAAHP